MTVLGLLAGDAASLRRDPMLVGAVLAPLLVVALLRVGAPTLTSAVPDLEAYLPLALGFAMLLPPLLAGFVVGFLVAEEAEERILDAIEVTPRGRRWFLGYRLGVASAVGGSGALIVATLAGVAFPGVGRTLAAVVLGSGTAALVAMTLAAFSKDRVQALALGKLTGFALVAALGFQLLSDPWRWLLAPLPPVWVLDLVAGGSWPVALLLGIVSLAGAGTLLFRRLL